MIKVECESCKAPYQIDERRVPAAGLKMRCPKCGHSFVVENPNAPAAAAPKPAAPPAPPPLPKKQTMQGVAPAGELPSDFPAALGSLDEAALPAVASRQSADLPALRADLPSPKGAPRPGVSGAMKPAPPPRPGQADLPVAVHGARAPFGAGGNLPVAKRPAAPAFGGDADLPAVASGVGLPAVASGAGLPSVAGGMGLPSVAGGVGLPSVAGGVGLPDPLGGKGFGEIDLPLVAESLPTAAQNLPVPVDALPAVPPPDRHLPLSRGRDDPFGDFGELDLPAQDQGGGGAENSPFANIELDAPKGGASYPPAGGMSAGPSAPPAPANAPGGMTYGELDLGGGDPQAAPIGAEAPLPSAPSEGIGEVGGGLPAAGGFEAPLPAAGGPVARERPLPAPRSRRWLVYVLVAAGVFVGGAALGLKPSIGPFGMYKIRDVLMSGQDASATTNAIADSSKRTASDTYDDAKAALDTIVAAQASSSRAKPLTAFSAFFDLAMTTRFGPDSSRPARGKVWLEQLKDAGDVKYLGAAQAAQVAVQEDWDKARKGLDLASKRDLSDPIQQDIALLRGEVELHARDGEAALAAFKRALELAPDARAHFGMARAYELAGDPTNEDKELVATLKISPQHPGAITRRAGRSFEGGDEKSALADLSSVLEGPLRAKASPSELADAYATKGVVLLKRGSMTDARTSFDEALKLDVRSTPALLGQGELFYTESRYTEALSRFDAALQIDQNSELAIVDDAKAKIALERLQDAKTQLSAAAAKFPRSMLVRMWLGSAEAHLGNKDAAEKDLVAAVELADPKKRDAVLPYVELASTLASEGRTQEAQQKLEEARKQLPDSAALERSFGMIAEVEGRLDEAVARYREALTKDPRDVGTRFHLGVALRRMRKFDDAASELDKVQASDKDFPGLALERGLLFEESGDVQKAIEQFKAALAKAPDDPDLQLRVGSAYVVINRPDDALPMLKSVLNQRPTSAEAHHYIGRAYFEKGSLADAARYLKRAVELDPNRAEYHIYLAWVSVEAMPPKLDVAKDETDKALALDRMLPEGYWIRGKLECDEGALVDGVKDLKRALTMRPSRFEAHAALAECYEQQSNYAEELTEWQRAVSGDATRPYWQFRLGKILLDKGQSGAALAHLKSAVEDGEKLDQRPAWLAPAEFAAATAFKKAGDKKDAVDHYKRYIDIAPASSPDLPEARKEFAALGGSDR